MNRNDFLGRTLPTWLKYDIFNEIIIVDYSSKEKCKSIIDQYQNGKIILIEVPNQKYFSLSKARNVGIKYVSSNYTLLIDVDIEMLKKLDDNKFFDGNCRTGGRKNDSRCGTVLLPTIALREVNGYNEHLVGYGYDDIDLYNRIVENKFNLHFAGISDYLFPINHSDEMKVAFYPDKRFERTNIMNHQVATLFRWNKQSTHQNMKERVYLPKK